MPQAMNNRTGARCLTKELFSHTNILSINLETCRPLEYMRLVIHVLSLYNLNRKRILFFSSSQEENTERNKQ